MVATSAEAPRNRTTASSLALLSTGLVLGLIVVAFAVAFLPSIQWMIGEWSGSAGVLSHGYLIAAISAVLFIRAIPEVTSTVVAPAWWVLPILLGMSVVWLLGYVANVVGIQTLMLPAILMVAIVAAYGIAAARPLAFPILFVYFAAPAWEHLQFIFQAISVFVVSGLIRAVGLPALIDGNLVHLSSGTFEIAGACSGLSFVVAGLSLSVLYGHLYYSHFAQTLRLNLIMFAVALLGNWIRVFAIIVVGYRSEMQSSLVDDHGTWGWILFAMLMVPVYFVATRIEDRSVSFAAKDTSVTLRHENGKRQNWLAVGAAILVMVAGPVWALTVSNVHREADNLSLEMPSVAKRWVGPEKSTWEWAPRFAGADAERVAEYKRNDAFVLVYTNLYLSQTQDKELVYMHNRIAGDWHNSKMDFAVDETVTTENGLRLRQVAARNYIGNWLIWYRYQIGEQFEISDTGAKFAQALNSLRGQPEAGVVAFATPCRNSCEAAAQTLTEFADRVGYMVRVDYNRDIK